MARWPLQLAIPMLIFNCTKAFAQFIEPALPAHNVPIVGEAPTQRPDDDLPHLIDEDGKTPRHLMQWQVDLTYIKEKPCAITMDIDTRYAMVFTNLGKGNVPNFLNTFAERLVNQMVFSAQSVSLLADFDELWKRFLATHARFQFFLRSDRSTLKHLKDAEKMFEYETASTTFWPETHEECAVFDTSLNLTPRKSRKRRTPFIPETEMLCLWMQTFAGLTPGGEQRIRQHMKQKGTEFSLPSLPEISLLKS